MGTEPTLSLLDLRFQGLGRPLAFGQRLDPPIDLGLFFLEPVLETRQLQPHIPGFPLELGTGREQAFPREDLGVFLDPLSLGLSCCDNAPRLFFGVGNEPDRCAARAPPKGPLDHKSNESEQQQTDRCYR